MTKKRIIVLSLTLAVTTLFIMRNREEAPVVTKISPTDLPTPLTPPVISKNLPAQLPTPSVPESAQTAANRPNPQWEGNLKKSLKAQAGNSLKDIKIVKERSFVYKKDEVALHVEAVLITLTNQQNVMASYRALVDSQTGKVLETWDRPVFDPAEVKKEFRFKLDPRYTN